MLATHNLLRDRHRALLRRLYDLLEPFCWNRQGEHADGDVVVHRFPVFSHDGKEVRGRFIKWLLYKGYELAGEPFDQAGQDAIETMFDIMSEPDRHVSFSLEAGQIQYLNNFRLAHCRTEYEDAADDPEARRHLVRIFLRDEGKRWAASWDSRSSPVVGRAFESSCGATRHCAGTGDGAFVRLFRPDHARSSARSRSFPGSRASWDRGLPARGRPKARRGPRGHGFPRSQGCGGPNLSL